MHRLRLNSRKTRTISPVVFESKFNGALRSLAAKKTIRDAKGHISLGYLQMSRVLNGGFEAQPKIASAIGADTLDSSAMLKISTVVTNV